MTVRVRVLFDHPSSFPHLMDIQLKHLNSKKNVSKFCEQLIYRKLAHTLWICVQITLIIRTTCRPGVYSALLLIYWYQNQVIVRRVDTIARSSRSCSSFSIFSVFDSSDSFYCNLFWAPSSSFILLKFILLQPEINQRITL